MTRAVLPLRAGTAIGRQLAHPSGVTGALVAAAMRLANRHPTRALIDALDVQPHHCVLDVGCGDGAALAALDHVSWRCGVDQSATMLGIAERRLGPAIAQGRVFLRRGDMQSLPIPGHWFDRIIAANLLYFCADVPAFIDECRRVARPGALLGIYVTSAASMAKWRFAGPATHRHFSEEQLADELQRANIPEADRRILRLSLPARVEGLIAIAALSQAQSSLPTAQPDSGAATDGPA